MRAGAAGQVALTAAPAGLTLPRSLARARSLTHARAHSLTVICCCPRFLEAVEVDPPSPLSPPLCIWLDMCESVWSSFMPQHMTSLICPLVHIFLSRIEYLMKKSQQLLCLCVFDRLSSVVPRLRRELLHINSSFCRRKQSVQILFLHNKHFTLD